jgi:hypothetical protein
MPIGISYQLPLFVGQGLSEERVRKKRSVKNS